MLCLLLCLLVARAAPAPEPSLEALAAQAEAAIAEGRPKEALSTVQQLQQALEALDEAPAEQRKRRGPLLNNTGLLLDRLGRPGEAVETFERALALIEADLGTEVPEFAATLNNLAGSLEQEGRREEARDAYARALQIKQRTLPPGHPSLAVAMNNLGFIEWSMGHYAAALDWLERCRDVLEDNLGEDHPYVAVTLNNLASIYSDQGALDEAEAMFQEALLRHERARGRLIPEYATTLGNLAGLYEDQGELARARSIREEALALRREIFGPDHPDVANALSSLGGVLNDQGDLLGARARLDEAIALLETLGQRPPELADMLQQRSDVRAQLGDLPGAEQDLLEAQALRAETVGTRDMTYGSGLAALGVLLTRQGRYDEARQAYAAAREVLADSEHAVLNQQEVDGKLTALLRELGDHAAALRQQTHYVDALRGSLGPEHPRTMSALAILGAIYDDAERLDEAEAVYQQVLTFLRQADPPDTNGIGTMLCNLGGLYEKRGELDRAEAAYRDGIEQLERQGDPHRAQVARQRANFALLRVSQGELDEAAALYDEAMVDLERALGPDHPDLASVLRSRALLGRRRGEPQVRVLLDRALAIAERRQDLLEALSEREAIAHLQDNRDTFMAWLVEHDHADEQREAWARTLRWKGIATRQVRARHAAALIEDPAVREVYDQLQASRRDRAALLTQRRAETEVFEQQLDALNREVEALERELGRRFTPPRREAPTPEEVCAALPEGTLLLDFVRISLGPVETYVVFAVDPRCEVARIEIEDANTLHELQLSWRESLQSPNALTARIDERGWQLSSRILTPLQPHLEGADTLLIRPDANLALLPWAALPTGPQRYLAQDHVLQLLPSVETLLDPGDAPVSGLLAVGGVDFGPRSPLPRLPGTGDEVASIAQRWRKGRHRREPSKTLTGAEARKSRVLADMPGARLVHLATHGFVDDGTWAMLESGLVLAPEDPGGLPSQLLADEVAQLDLSGTELVVLSACQTGLGAATSGEGVLGLQRGFSVAGARAIGMTLWSVEDQASAELMAELYRRLLDKRAPLAPARALQEAQRARIAQNLSRLGEARPQDWAGFVLAGGLAE